MTDKEALEQLKLHDYWTQFSWQDEVCELAISAFESIDRITAERDALMHELRILSACPTCIKYFDCNRTDIITGSEKKCWEWRGATDD